jgi:hypothetical protein
MLIDGRHAATKCAGLTRDGRGMRPEPAALVPSAIGTSQVATATAEPELEPLGERGVEGTDCSRLVLPR